MNNAIKKPAKGKIIMAGKVVRKADTKIAVPDLLYQEDDFIDYYLSTNAKQLGVIVPPFNPKTLKALTTRNNVLAQAIAAMNANIDSTGWTAEPVDPLEKDETEKAYLEEFFSEPYPNKSFTAMRRSLREDIEGVGYGILEVLRSMDNEIVALRHIDATTMRLCRLGEARATKRTLRRKGKIVDFTFIERGRIYVQKVGTKFIYFKDFGNTDKISRLSGEVVREGDTTDLATEVLYFKCESDIGTPYGVPRWINQLPSIVGSRKAEEYNLDFFDAGGVPPAVVFVQGGTLAPDVKTQLDGFFSSKGASKHRVAVVEVQSSSGDLNSNGSVNVSTERFGDSASTDSMFSNYDKSCEEHVRVAFRIPPLFLGRAQDYNFATAQTAYMVTEAQVFQPERTEFDDALNVTIIRAMGITKWKFKSNPLTMKNVDAQLKSIELVKTMVDPEELVATVNTVSGLNLRFSKKALELSNSLITAATTRLTTTQDGDNVKAQELQKLAGDWAVSVGLVEGDISEAVKNSVVEAVQNLSGDSLSLFNSIISNSVFGTPTFTTHKAECGCSSCAK